MKKIYVALKKDTKNHPHLHCKFHKNSPVMDLYEYGIRYFENKIGWYYKYGELICTAD